MSFSESGGIITQTGIDNDLSGLNGITGVTRYVEEDMIIYDVASTHRFLIQGALHHDPEKEVLIVRHDWVSGSTPAILINYGTNAWKNVTAITRDSDNRFVLTVASHGYVVGEAVEFQVTDSGTPSPSAHLHQVVYPILAVTTNTLTLGMTEYSDYLPTLSGTTNRVTRRPVYHYGKEKTAFGNTRLSVGTGLLIVGNKENNFQERGSGLKVEFDGLFRGRGGTIYSSRPTALNGYSDIDGTELVSPTLLDCRSMSGGSIKNFKLVNNQFSGVQASKLFNRGFTLSEGVLMETLSQSYYEVVLRDLDTSNNTGYSDIGHSSNDTYPHRDWIIINSKAGSSVRGMYRSSTGLRGDTQKGVTVVKKEVSFNLKDSNGSAIQGVEMYMSDTPDPNYSKNATFPAPLDTSRPYTSELGTNTLGVLNADGTATYDYTNAIEYTGTSDASGLIDTQQVTIGVQILEYLSVDPSASSQGGNGGPYDITLSGNNWVDSSGERPTTAAWDTTEFGGFYKVDRRGNGNTDADEFTFKFCSYGHSLSSTTQSLKGLGELVVNWVLFDDQLITDTRAEVDGYTVINTPEKFYNKAKAYLVDNYAGETETIVSRSGNSIDAGNYNVVVDANASQVFSISGSTITIKATQFIGNINTGGTATTQNGAEVIGTFGTISTYPWEIQNVEGISRIQIYNVTEGFEIDNLKLTSTAGSFVTASGTYQTGVGAGKANLGDEIRIRITCAAGTTAFLPFETTTVATTSGFTVKALQESDTVYNDNGIDGSQVTGLTADYNSPMGVDINDADGVVDARDIYAFYAVKSTEEAGIANWFGAITAIDSMNYRVNVSVSDIKLQNIGSSAVVVSGARIFRDNNTSVLHAENNDKPISLDTGMLVQYIQPQLDAAMNLNEKLDKTNKNTNLIPGLL